VQLGAATAAARATTAAPDAPSGPPLTLPSPRPWPPSLQDLPRASTWPVLSARGPADVTACLLTLGAMGAALLPGLEAHTRLAPRQPRSEWSARATPRGWTVPRNPSRTPVKPGAALEVREGTEDLGPLRVVPSMSGRLRAMRLQWPEEFQEPAFSAQKMVVHDVLTRLPHDVVVHIVAEGMSAPALRSLLEGWRISNPDRVHIHILQLHSTPERWYQPMTMWSRDGAILMRSARGRDVLLLPRSFRRDGQVDRSLNRVVVQGTGAAPALLASALPELEVRRSGLIFEGGDVVASRRAVLLGGDSVAASCAELGLSRDEVVERFTRELGRPVIVIEPQPEFHVDLGFTFLDDDTVAVADPDAAMQLASQLPGNELAEMVLATQQKQLAAKYDRAAAMLAQLGYRVCRVPNLCGIGLSTPYLTYNNVLIEQYGDVRRVYMPVYDVPLLDEAAREVYRQHGFTVMDMPSARHSTKLWGAIRCATGELAVSD
jgi:hypothetical protein